MTKTPRCKLNFLGWYTDWYCANPYCGNPDCPQWDKGGPLGQQEAPGAQPLEPVTEAPEPNPRPRETEKYLVDTAVVKQSENEWTTKYVTLNLWSDGSVTWETDV